jgi:hypothetical protein
VDRALSPATRVLLANRYILLQHVQLLFKLRTPLPFAQRFGTRATTGQRACRRNTPAPFLFRESKKRGLKAALSLGDALVLAAAICRSIVFTLP